LQNSIVIDVINAYLYKVYYAMVVIIGVAVFGGERKFLFEEIFNGLL
jgi:hypothetical protein